MNGYSAMRVNGEIVWLTDAELTAMFLGQLDMESHFAVRRGAPLPDLPEPYRAPETKVKPAPKPVVRVPDDKGIHL